MTPRSDVEDTSKALHSDGSWYILPTASWMEKIEYYDYPHASVIYHQCRNHWQKHNKSEIWVPPVSYRISLSEMNIPCSSCFEVCPEGLQGLWQLHNYDSLQKHDV